MPGGPTASASASASASISACRRAAVWEARDGGDTELRSHTGRPHGRLPSHVCPGATPKSHTAPEGERPEATLRVAVQCKAAAAATWKSSDSGTRSGHAGASGPAGAGGLAALRTQTPTGRLFNKK